MNIFRLLSSGLLILCLTHAQAQTKQRSDYSFIFDSSAVGEGTIVVDSQEPYTPEKGYGFDYGTTLNKEPFYFSVKVPEGNYRVTVRLGDNEIATKTTIKSESRRLMLEGVETQPGEFITRSFIVNIKDRQITPDRKVSLKPRELPKLDWDDKLTLEFHGNNKVSSIEIEKVEDLITVFLAGNSTVVNQDDEPWASWGQMITRFFKPEIAIANHAESGLSLGSFISSKRLEKVLSVMKPGDYLFVEFGHNDSKEKGINDGPFKSYTERLHFFASEVKKKGGKMVVLTPIARRSFDNDGRINNTHGDYPAAARLVAKKENIPLIDLTNLTTTLFETLGVEGSKSAFVIYPELQLNDNTHFNPYGAYEIAKLVVQGIKDNKMEIANYLVETPEFSPSQPLPPEQYVWPASPKASLVKPDGN